MRNEKKLLALPWPECPEIEQKAAETKNRWSSCHYWRFTAQLHTTGGEPVLGITVFNMGGTPKRRYWISETQHGMQVVAEEKTTYSPQREPGKMYSASIDTEMSVNQYYGTQEILYSTAENEKAVYDFCGKAENINKALAKFLQRQRSEANERKHARERESIQNWFSLLPPIPEEERDWERDCVTIENRYFFYEYTGRKHQHGWCSYCGAESELPDIRQYQWGECPKCKSRVNFRSIKYLNHRRTQWYGTHLLQRAGDYIVSRNLHVCIAHEIKDGKPQTEINHYEYSRMFYDSKGEAVACFDKSNTTHVVTVDGFHRADFQSPALISPIGLEELRKERGIRAPLEVLAERGKLSGRWGKIEEKTLRHAEIEYLIKMGLYTLCGDQLDERAWSSRALLKGKTATEIIGLPMAEIEKLRRADVSGRALIVIRQLYKCGISMKAEDMQQLDRLHIETTYCETLLQMTKRRSIKRALNYIEKQCGSGPGDRVLIEWRDYMAMARQVNWDIRQEQIAFPKRLGKAHEEVTKLIKLRENAETDKKIGRQADRLAPLTWQFDGLCIFPARSMAELTMEGQKLSHCVGRGGYGQKMANGQTAIFFIRRQKEQATAYVTLELSLSTGKVIQCYGKSDNYPGDKVKAFYQRWEKTIVSKFFKNEKEVKTA